MPAGKTKAKGKGGGGEKKKGAKAAEEIEEIIGLSRVFLKSYQQRCLAAESTASPRICRELRNCIENKVGLSKFVLEPSLGLPPRPPPSSSRGGRGPSSRVPSRGPTPRGPSAATAAAAPSSSGAAKSANGKDATSSATKPPILLQPLVESWTAVKYAHVRCLHVWNMELQDDATVSLALFFESALGPNIKVLELRETKLSPWAVNRLSKSLVNSQLTTLNLDFNPIVCSSLNKLCESLQRVISLSSLSLNFCQLEPLCGEALGVLTATSQIKELSLIGNHLECDGFNEFFRPLVSIADAHISVSEPLVQEDNKTANTETAPTTSPSQQLLQDAPPTPPPPAPPPMPPITKLFLQDNCIDIHGECHDMDGVFSSVIAMRTLKRYLMSSPLLEEINLEGNWIGEGGAREVMLALQQRKEVGLPPLKVNVSPRICPIIFTQIMELNPTSGKKKGRGKKGKKKKK